MTNVFLKLKPLEIDKAILSLFTLALCMVTDAQDWQPINNAQKLSELFSGTVMETELKSGSKATARYSADGTGVVKAWGGTFNRTWEVSGNDLVCIDIQGVDNCFKIDSNPADNTSYRAHNQLTGETIIFTVRPEGIISVADSDTKPGGNAAKPSTDELAKELANPNTALATLNLKNQFTSYEGDLPGADDQDNVSWLFQPILPFVRDDGSKIIFRPAIPIFLDRPRFDANAGSFDEASGLGDIAFDLAYAPSLEDPGQLLAYGVFGSMPTASDDLGTDRWTLGPELLVGRLNPKFIYGLLANHQWDFAGSGDADISTTTLNILSVYLPGGGWNTGSSPAITYDWKSEQWTVPLQASIGKTVVIGGRPWKFSFEANYYVEKADAFGPDWQISFNIGPVVKNAMADWFK